MNTVGKVITYEILQYNLEQALEPCQSKISDKLNSNIFKLFLKTIFLGEGLCRTENSLSFYKTVLYKN